jgi:hypothetical protein
MLLVGPAGIPPGIPPLYIHIYDTPQQGHPTLFKISGKILAKSS